MNSPDKHRRPWVDILLLACVLIAAPATAADVRSDLAKGKAVYKKANCVGCHKWHGGGGGGYGGVASSLRATSLDAEGLALVIRCGRPGTRMPFHNRHAYREDDRDCYGATATELGEAVPPRAHYFLKQRDIDAVVGYVQTQIQGRGEPGYDDCVAFWGEDARRCRLMAERN